MAKKTYTPIQKIDLVLKTIKNSDERLAEFQLYRLHVEHDINEIEMKAILNRLTADGYILRSANNFYDEGFIASFDGMLFAGYENDSKAKQDQNLRLKHIEENQMQQAMSMTTLTTWIAIATVVAGIYYVTQLIDWFSKLKSGH